MNWSRSFQVYKKNRIKSLMQSLCPLFLVVGKSHVSQASFSLACLYPSCWKNTKSGEYTSNAAESITVQIEYNFFVPIIKLPTKILF